MGGFFHAYFERCSMNCNKCFWQSGKCTHPKPEKRIEDNKVICRGFDTKGVLINEFTRLKREVGAVR